MGERLADALGRPLAARLGAALVAALVTPPAAAAATTSDIVVLISADTEWRQVRAIFGNPREQQSPLGEWLVREYKTPKGPKPVLFFHSGWGKVSSGAATQYAIDRWHPRLLVNLGTCGGFAGDVERDQVILVSDTLLYDIHELMGDSQEAIDHYATRLDPGLWPNDQRAGMKIARLISADRDIDPAAVPELRRRFGAIAGDWESAAIAFTAARNKTPLVILRGVTDVVTSAGSEAYGSMETFEAGARRVMRDLLTRFQAALPQLGP